MFVANSISGDERGCEGSSVIGSVFPARRYPTATPLPKAAGLARCVGCVPQLSIVLQVVQRSKCRSQCGGWKRQYSRTPQEALLTIRGPEKNQ